MIKPLFELPAWPLLPVEGGGCYPLRRLFCVGRNYAAHAAEMGAEVDRAAPFYFTKSPAAAVWGDEIAYPPMTEDLHHEVELAVALGPDGAVWGHGVALDMTRRDLQAEAKDKRHPWDMGKDFDQSAVFAPLKSGPVAPGAEIALRVNGALRQAAPLADMIHDVPALLADLGRYTTLGAGDVILTGTPAGVGAVQRGDLLEGEITALPPLRVRVA